MGQLSITNRQNLHCEYRVNKLDILAAEVQSFAAGPNITCLCFVQDVDIN